jgi:hypothetical protein
MEFLEVIEALGRGSTVLRQKWIDANPDLDRAEMAVRIINGFLAVSAHGENFLWTPRFEDLIAKDWEIHVPRPAPEAPRRIA